MTDAEEQAYTQGERAAWLHMFRECLRNLGYDSPEVKGHGWIKEREEAVNQLRDLCRDFGDNDWDNDLNLSDVIEKHLSDYLYAVDRSGGGVVE